MPNEYDSRDGSADVGAACGPKLFRRYGIPAGARFLSCQLTSTSWPGCTFAPTRTASSP